MTNLTIDLPAFVVNDPVERAALKLKESFERSLKTRLRIAEYMELHHVSEELAP